MGRRPDFPTAAVQLTARSGFITRKLFTTYFVNGRPVRSQLRAWNRLLSSGLFVRHHDPRFHDVFLLNKRKQIAQYGNLNNLVRTPYSGIIRHDETVLHGLLNIQEHGFLESWALEPEFRAQGTGAVRLEHYGQTSKYPDAILQFKAPEKSIAVAIEVELSMKDKRRYQRIMNAYSFASDLSLVLFVCGDERIENAVRASARQHFLPPREMEIGYMKNTEWLNDPILATMRTEHRECTLGTWIYEKEQEQLLEP